MSATVRSVSGNVQPSGASVVVTKPTGLATDDVLYAVLETPTGSLPTITPPAGFTQHTVVSNNLFFFSKPITNGAGEPASYTWTSSSSTTHVSCVMIAVTGADTSTPYASALKASGTATAQSTITVPSVTGLTSDTYLVIRAFGNHANTSGSQTVTWDTSGGFISHLEEISGSAPTTNAVAWESITGTATGTRTLGVSFASGTDIMLTVVIANAPVSVPSVTTAPAVTGTLAVAATLTSDNGAWTGSPSSYADQWQKSTDGGTTYTNISGATSGAYVVQAADNNTFLRCRVTAHNAAGDSTPANSNAVQIPAVPTSSVPPSITTDGSPTGGETVTAHTGTWIGTVSTYTIQYYRGGSAISGAVASGGGTTLDYTLTGADEGAVITVGVIAHGPGGNSSEAFSSPITPLVHGSLDNTTGTYYYSGGAGNTSPSASIGGARGASIPLNTIGSVFGPIPGSVGVAGGTFYAVIIITNGHPFDTLVGSRLYIPSQPTSTSLHIDVAVPTQLANQLVPALASRTTAPTGVTFVRPTDFASAPAYGDLAPLAFRCLYVRLTVDPGAQPVSGDTFTIRVESQPA